MYKKYVVELTDTERTSLRDLIAAGAAPARTLAHARILLKADAAPGGPAWSDAHIADAVEVSVRTVVRVRQAFQAGRLARALPRQRPTGSRHRKVDGLVEAHLVALVCSPPPDDCPRWTLRLLTDRLVALVDLDSLSPETVRLTLKKTNLSPG
jgi:Homeodomain-like domain